MIGPLESSTPSQLESLAVLVLAAGKGTRMKSDLVKVLHPLMGQPIIAHVLNSARYLNPVKTIVVVGHQADRVKSFLSDQGLTFVLQSQQLGTGHAVAAAREALADFSGTVLILSGDVPLLSPQTLMDFLAAHQQSRAALSVLTVDLPQPGPYGRVIRDADGYLAGIVEARDAQSHELAVTEINTGIYAVDSSLLFDAVSRLKPENDQKEYYLTDVVADARNRGQTVAAIMGPDPEEVLGINDRADLAMATASLRVKINVAWMRAGVTMIDSASIYIETTVKLAPDVTLWPGVILTGRTVIGAGSVIGPGCQIDDAIIGRGVHLKMGCYVEKVEIPPGTMLGPLTTLTPETQRKVEQ